MKTRFTLECAEEFDFTVLAINSHIKAYKLCWNINSSMQLNFEKKNDHNIKEDLEWLEQKTKRLAAITLASILITSFCRVPIFLLTFINLIRKH